MVSILPDGMSNMEATVSFLIIDTIALILRVISRIQTKGTTTTGRFIRYDDWWILAAYLIHHDGIRHPRAISSHGSRSPIENA
ncbi:uncharacterized protein Bfra_005093 [Botrytis fragariae]|uniref:Uncharacterized protein n=1 Tax=Botrytis fragariae TaxID=1964551 RepID=A0A8H6EIM4_9HELO|nr:uncharacterized protein Bfra_005093 [Botrytis fragariae]KAF5873629.1 hypothetical protein Bfra_005093 [Botrytis fragariae]